MPKTATEEQTPPMTVLAVSKYLDVHKAHVTLLLRRGSLAGRKWGSTWMVDPLSAERYLRKHRKPRMGRPRGE